MMRGIFRRQWRRATRGAAILLAGSAAIVGCAGRSGASALGPAAAIRMIPLSQALLLQTSGATPQDTTVTFPAGARYTIIVRHAPPDHQVFAELYFPPEVFAADSGKEVTVQLRMRPGIYGFSIRASASMGGGALVTFKYPRYFAAPPEARSTYGSDVAFERALAIGRLQGDSMIALFPSTRPASDNLQAPLPSMGTYVVAAPR